MRSSLRKLKTVLILNRSKLILQNVTSLDQIQHIEISSTSYTGVAGHVFSLIICSAVAHCTTCHVPPWSIGTYTYLNFLILSLIFRPLQYTVMLSSLCSEMHFRQAPFDESYGQVHIINVQPSDEVTTFVYCFNF